MINELDTGRNPICFVSSYAGDKVSNNRITPLYLQYRYSGKYTMSPFRNICVSSGHSPTWFREPTPTVPSELTSAFVLPCLIEARLRSWSLAPFRFCLCHT